MISPAVGWIDSGRVVGVHVTHYYENADATPPTGPTTVPLGLAAFGGDFSGIRRFAGRGHANIVHWSEFDRGGHFAAHKVPDLLVPAVRAFFRDLR